LPFREEMKKILGNILLQCEDAFSLSLYAEDTHHHARIIDTAVVLR